MRCHFDVLHRSADAAKGWSALSGIAEDINRYYDYLTNEIKLQVTIHDTDERKFANIILTPERLIKNRHTNPYCLFVKSNEEIQEIFERKIDYERITDKKHNLRKTSIEYINKAFSN